MCIRASTWFDLGGFDCDTFKAYYEDDDFGIRANLYGNIQSELPVAVCPKALIYHNVSQTIVHNEANGKLREISRINFEGKWPELEWDASGQYMSDITELFDPKRIFYNGSGRSHHEIDKE
jgi:GT2 family glycosyltransferase